MKRLQFSLASILIAGAAFLPPAATAASDPVDALIEDLHQCIQRRFTALDGRFGFARIITPGSRPYHFTTENLRESAVVGSLGQAGVRVVAYLGARVEVEPPRGPVAMVGDAAGAPAPIDLRERGRLAMGAVSTGSTYAFTEDGWRFQARPITATTDVCLTCHHRNAGLTIGDAVGVVLYGYK